MKSPEFWRRGQGGLAAVLLSPLGWAYGFAGRLRRMLSSPMSAPVPVICIGNVVAGGAGKTPVALDLATRLKTMGRRVSFLSRGYGGSERGPHLVNRNDDAAARVGDEPLLLSRIAPTWVARDRTEGARSAGSDNDVIIMDDGFQNPSLVKTCSLLVIDGHYGFGNGHLIPAGPLREAPAQALKRADGVIILGDDRADVALFVHAVRPGLPVLRAVIVPGAEIETLKNQDLTVFAGIGAPEKFFRTLKHGGCTVVSERAFPDHHPYTAADIKSLRSLANAPVSRLVTTEKDYVRIPDALQKDIEVLTITLQWEDEAALNSLLDQLF